jgi:hypothetical protein
MIGSSKVATLNRKTSLFLFTNRERRTHCLLRLNPEHHRSDAKGGERMDCGTVISITLAEPSFQGDYDGLPLIGQPDAILFEGMRATSILEYKVTDSDQLHRSHRVQLLLYGYLIAQNFNIDNLVLICVLVPHRHSKWLDKLTPAKAQKFIEIISAKAETLIATQPSRKNWHCLGVIVHRDIKVNLRVFKYDQKSAKHELEFFSQYWRGEREAVPTTMPRKCAVCLYNRVDLCPVAQVPYGENI